MFFHAFKTCLYLLFCEFIMKFALLLLDYWFIFIAL